jgi:hypothetical protein
MVDMTAGHILQGQPTQEIFYSFHLPRTFSVSQTAQKSPDYGNSLVLQLFSGYASRRTYRKPYSVTKSTYRNLLSWLLVINGSVGWDINSAYIIQCGKLWIRIPDPVSGEKYLINNHE